jgi:hypothetical protein
MHHLLSFIASRSLLKLVLHHVGQAFHSVVGDASSAAAIGLQVS